LDEVVDGEMVLSEYGRIVDEEWHHTAQLRPYVTLDAFVVMPNHIHGILWIEGCRGEPRPYPPCGVAPGSLGTIVGAFKSVVTRRINQMRGTLGAPVWQRNYWEHIIRSEQALQAIRQYILNNPARWHLDRYHPAAVGRDPQAKALWQLLRE